MADNVGISTGTGATVAADEIGVVLAAKAKGAYEDIFKSVKPQNTDYHNTVSYF